LVSLLPVGLIEPPKLIAAARQASRRRVDMEARRILGVTTNRMAEAATMPDFTVKEVRLPELHLPELKRDEIVRALSGVRVPEVDLARVEPRRRLRGMDMRTLLWRRRAMSATDAGRLIAAAVTAVRIVRPQPPRSRWFPLRRSRWSSLGRTRDELIAVVRPAPRRSRRRIVAIVIALTAAGWILFRNPAVRSRLDAAAGGARRRIDAMRSPLTVDVDLDTGEPVAVTATELTPTDAGDSIAIEGEIALTGPATNLA
jgi:hypothetical protein